MVQITDLLFPLQALALNVMKSLDYLLVRISYIRNEQMVWLKELTTSVKALVIETLANYLDRFVELQGFVMNQGGILEVGPSPNGLQYKIWAFYYYSNSPGFTRAFFVGDFPFAD